MNSIKKFSCEDIAGAEISCVIVNGEPWFKAKDIVTILGYGNTKKAVQTNVDDEDKKQFKDLDVPSMGSLDCPHDLSRGPLASAVFVNESGLYSLILRSNKPEAKVFKRWVTSHVLPQIRKTGSYKGRYDYWRNSGELGSTPKQRWGEVKKLAVGREDELHYAIANHIRKQYPDATINAGIGEHLTTDHARMDAYLKGYTGGQPDMIIIRGLPNGFQDVLAIELKNPNKKGRLSIKQQEYIDDLELNCKVQTIVGCEYDDIILRIHDHYKDVFSRAEQSSLKRKHSNFATNENPSYWCRKHNLTALHDECDTRGIPTDEFHIKSKSDIARILITFDKNN